MLGLTATQHLIKMNEKLGLALVLLLLLSPFLVERQVDGFQKEIKSPYCRQGHYYQRILHGPREMV